jgi:hypothetical protein
MVRFALGTLVATLVGLGLAACNSATAPMAVATAAPTASTATLLGVDLAMAQSVSLSLSSSMQNPCTSGSFGLTQQFSGGVFTTTVAPSACVLLGVTVNGNPSVSFNGTYTGSGTTLAGNGNGPVGGFTMSANGQTFTCSIPAGQKFTLSAGGQHGSQTGGPFVCNGVTYMLPQDNW